MRTRLLTSVICPLVGLAFVEAAAAGSTNGVAGSMPTYYDGQLFTINFKQEPTSAEAALLAHNGSLNVIYMCDACAGQVAGGDFTSVIDAIQADGFNPLWQEVQVEFLTIAPQQFTSDNDILAAEALGEIALHDTTEVYRCSVVGPGPKK